MQQEDSYCHEVIHVLRSLFVEFHVTPVTQGDITAEQDLATAFREAGQITEQVNVAQITTNILPAGFDSNDLQLNSA